MEGQVNKTISVLVEYDPGTKTYGATSPDLPAVYAVSDSREDVIMRFERSADEYLRLTRDGTESQLQYVVAEA